MINSSISLMNAENRSLLASALNAVGVEDKKEKRKRKEKWGSCVFFLSIAFCLVDFCLVE